MPLAHTRTAHVHVTLRRCTVFALGIALLAGVAAPSAAQKTGPAAVQNTIYGGAGTQRSSPDVPFVIGYLYMPPKELWTVGVDFAAEGVYTDGTYGSYTVERAPSLNLLVGFHSRLEYGWRFGAAALLGARLTDKDCPNSYLGYQCYADADPTVNYGVNYGALVHLSFKNVMLGARRTGESSQVGVGVAF